MRLLNVPIIKKKYLALQKKSLQTVGHNCKKKTFDKKVNSFHLFFLQTIVTLDQFLDSLVDLNDGYWAKHYRRLFGNKFSVNKKKLSKYFCFVLIVKNLKKNERLDAVTDFILI